MSHSRSQHRRDVVFTFGLEMFDDVVRREFCRPADQAVLALARDPRVGHLLVSDPWRSYAISAARRRPLRLVDEISVGDRSATLVRPHRLRRAEPTRTSTIARSYRSYAAALGKALARARGEPRARARSASLVTCYPFVAAYCAADWIGDVVYYGRDDWATSDVLPEWQDAYVEAYRVIDERATAIFVVSDELARRVSARAQVVPNGVDPAIWRPRYAEPSRVSELARPRAVYSGTIDDRLDRRLVELTSAAVGSLVMIGPQGSPAIAEWLRSLDNVHVFDAVGQHELAATVQACDLGIIPHRDHGAIRAMSPLKLYEFLAAGLPVAAVDLPPIRGVADDRVRLCSPDGWPDALADALEMDRASDEARLRFIEAVAWDRRLRPLVEAAVVEHQAAVPRT